MTTHHDIHQGPPKFDLMLALFDRNPNTRNVDFRIGGDRNVTTLVIITGVELEDGSGESWIFKGYVQNTSMSKQCRGWYRTDSRRGWIEFLD